MEELCPVCHNNRKPGVKFCEHCGHHFEENRCPQCGGDIIPGLAFCGKCGYKLTASSDSQTVESTDNTFPIVRSEDKIVSAENTFPGSNFDDTYTAYESKPKKSPRGIIISVAAVVVLLIAAAVVFLVLNKSSKTNVPQIPQNVVEKKEPAPPKYSYESPSVIHPALYQSTDYIVYFKGSSEVEKEMLLTVEIPGFTQKYEQKITLLPQELILKIRPPMIEGVLQTLNTSKEAQIKVTLQDVGTQKYLIQDSKPINLLSKYDMQWVSEDGSETYYENICAWVTPEEPKVKELLRNSIDQLTGWTDGAINALVGYQAIGGMNEYDVTYYQVAAIYQTLRSYYNVRYNATPVSTSGNGAQQRIALPKDVIEQESGLCIETAVTMASAIEATGMHPMIIILPGHAQVAVEYWGNTGEYLLIETTALTESNWDNILVYLDKDSWTNYLDNNNAIVIDVELARKDGIKPME